MREARQKRYTVIYSEFLKIAASCAIGFGVMGAIGYVIKLLFIPINNIILSWFHDIHNVYLLHSIIRLKEIHSHFQLGITIEKIKDKYECDWVIDSEGFISLEIYISFLNYQYNILSEYFLFFEFNLLLNYYFQYHDIYNL